MTPTATQRKGLAVLAGLAVVGAVAVGAATLLPSSRPTWKVPATIDATGKADVTVALNTWLRRVPNGANVVFPAKANYKAEGSILFDSKKDVVVEGNYAQIFATTDGATTARPNPLVWWQPPNWPLNRVHVLLYRSSDLVVSHLRVKGPNPGGPNTYTPRVEGQAGIEVNECVRCQVRDSIVNHTYGDGIEVNRSTVDLTVSGNNVSYTGRQGMTVLNSTNTRFLGNTLASIGRTFFDLEPERGGFLRGVTIANNTVIAPAGGIFVGAEGAGSTGDVNITANTLKGVAMVIRDHNSDNVTRRGKISVVNNTTTFGYDNYPIGMMVFGHVDGVTVTGNTASAKPDEAVRLGDSTATIVSGNSWQR